MVSRKFFTFCKYGSHLNRAPQLTERRTEQCAGWIFDPLACTRTPARKFVAAQCSKLGHSDNSNLTPPTFISVPLQKNIGPHALQESKWQLSTWFNIFASQSLKEKNLLVRMWRAFNPQSCLLLVAVASSAPTGDEAGHLSEVRNILKTCRAAKQSFLR